MALVLARGRFWGKSLLDGLVHLSLVMPPVVTGYLLLLLGRRGPLGQFLDDHFAIVFAFRWTGAALAYAVMGFPLMVRAIRLSIEAVDRRVEEAGNTLGARPVWVFLLITLPLSVPGIIAGMILSFARSMGEFGATITFVSNIPGETQTASIAERRRRRRALGSKCKLPRGYLYVRAAGRRISCQAPQPHSSGQLASNGATTRRSVGFCCVPRFPCLFAGSLELV